MEVGRLSSGSSAARRRFQAGIVRAVAELGGDRAAEEASGVSKSVWYDAKQGRSVPEQAGTWPAMCALLSALPVSVTGVRDWADLYGAVLMDAGRAKRLTSARSLASGGLRPLQLPPGPGGFVARRTQSAELGRLLLRPAGPAVPIAVVVGQPGVGKTAFAIHWAERAAREFPDGVLYADLRGWGPDRPAAADEVLPGWLRALGLDPATVAGHVDSYAAMLRTVLKDRRVLIVLDNAGAEEHVRPLLPGTTSCSVLITSRRHLVGLAVHHGAELIRLDPLAAADSVRLLREVVGDRVDYEPEEAAALAGLCGHLPLALRLLAQNVKYRPSTALASFRKELTDAGRPLGLMSSDDPRSDPRTVFSWSYEQLPGDIARTFRLFGVFPGRDLNPDAAAALAGVSSTTITSHLSALARAHLISETPTGRFELHDLMRLYAAEVVELCDSTQTATAARQRLFDYYQHTMNRADELVEPLRYRLPTPSGNATSTPLHDQAEALAWLDAECANVVTMCAVDRPELDAERWQLAFRARGYFFRAKRLPEWVRSHEYALEAALRLGDQQAQALTRSNLGVALHERGDDTGALLQYQIAQQLFEELGDDNGVSNTLAHQAAVLRRRGDLADSLRLSRLALDQYRRVNNDRNIAITLRGIGLAELELGRLDAAERHLTEALDLCGKLGMHMDAARAGNTLGQVRLRAGRHETAEQTFRAAMAADRSSGSRFESALALRGLGSVAAAVGDTAQAERHWLEALDILESLGSPKAAEVLTDLEGLRADRPDQSAD